MERMFQNEGVEIVVASNGREGVDKVRDRNFDLIVTDLLMPEMDGEEFVAALNDMNVTSPVVVISADVQASTQEKMFDLGIKKFIEKPLKEQDVAEIVDQFLKVAA